MTLALVTLMANTGAFLLILAIVNKGRINPLAPVTLFNIGFYYSYFVSGFWLQYDFGTYVVYPQIWAEPAYPLAVYFLPAWLGLISFNVGYLSRRRADSLTYTGPPSKARDRRIQPRAVVPLILLSSCIISAVTIFYALPTSVFDLLSDMEAWELFRNQVMVYWIDANHLYLLPVYIGFFHLCVLSYQPAGFLWRCVLFALVMMSLVILGSRALVLSWIISLLVFREQIKGGVAYYLKYLALGVVAVSAGALGIVQKITAEGRVTQELPFPFNLFRRLQTSYDQFECLVDMIGTEFSLDFGRSIIEDVFITYLPRSVFAWKPVDVGFMRPQNVLFYDAFWSLDRGTTYPVGIIAELYFNLWYFGVALGMCGLGVLLGKIERLVKTDFSYRPVLCALAGTFAAPHRTFGTLIMSTGLFLVFIVVNNKLSASRVTLHE